MGMDVRGEREGEWEEVRGEDTGKNRGKGRNDKGDFTL